MTRNRLFHLFALILLASPVLAQRGDRKGHVMEPPPGHWKIPAAPVLSAGAALKSFSVEDGFRIELVAAEPMIHDPVALAFDGNGRIWVVEMRGFMPNIDGKGEDAKVGRITVLEDTDDDGKIDRHTVFIDEIVMPRTVALADADRTLLWADGQKLYETEIQISPKTGAISAGKTAVIDEKYASGGNPEHKPNGMMYALDNWRYNAKSDSRYRKIDGEWVWEKTEGRGQWGISMDDYGRLFTNTNSNFVTADAVAPGVTIRNRNQEFRGRKNTRMGNQKTWPSRITCGINRGYLDGYLDENGFLTRPTAVSGLAVYRGHQFPEEFYGNLFLNEPGGNLVKRAVMTESPDGGWEIEPAYEGREFFTSLDERSRIVNCYTAPDGTLYLVDMYRGILQHAAYVTTYLRKQIEDRALDMPVGLGRIWRVRHENGNDPGAAPKMQEESSVELVAHLSHPNGWWRDTAQRILVERADESAVEPLQELLKNSDNPLARIHAGWTLAGLEKLTPEDVADGLKQSAKQPWAAAELIRAADFLAETDAAADTLAALKSATEMKSPHVRRQLAASLGLYGRTGTAVLAETLADSDDELATELAISSVEDREIDLLSALPASHGARPGLIAAVLKGGDKESTETLFALAQTESDFRMLGESVVALRKTDAAVKLLSVAADGKARDAVSGGMLAAAKSGKFKPLAVKSLPENLDPKLGKVFQIGGGKKVVFLKTASDKKLFEVGKVNYTRVCMACHQDHGKGQSFLAPPLVDSEWLTGPDKRLIALTMDGATGPIHVNGKLYEAPEIQPLMPGLRTNPEVNDEQIAAILTYVRNAWGNAGPPIYPKAVTDYRKNNEMHAPFTEKQLKAIK
ncbi:MAG: c-type cytochrome [Verrucomicrobiales bacterium]|nr:c-type cytochrome [Verrucomicrobiales bacterium]